MTVHGDPEDGVAECQVSPDSFDRRTRRVIVACVQATAVHQCGRNPLKDRSAFLKTTLALGVVLGLVVAVVLLPRLASKSGQNASRTGFSNTPVPAQEPTTLHRLPTMPSEQDVVEENFRRSILPAGVEVDHLVIRKMAASAFAGLGGGGSSDATLVYVVAFSTRSPFPRSALFGDSGMDLAQGMHVPGDGPQTLAPNASQPAPAATDPAPWADASGLTSIYYLLDVTDGSILGRGVIGGYFWSISDLEREFPPLP